MAKRFVALYLSVVVMFSAVVCRLCYLMTENADAVTKLSSYHELVIGQNRGVIYDCRGRRLTNEQTEYYAAVPPDYEYISELSKTAISESQRSDFSKGLPVAIRVDSGFHSDKIVTVSVKKRYSSSTLATHIIGYLDSEKRGVSGIEQAYDDILSGEDITVSFVKNAKGKILCGITPTVNIPQNKGAVTLTIDKNIQQITESAAKKYLTSGAVVVLDNNSGKIRAICSLPSISPLDIAKSLDDEAKPFVNRALSAYNIGSVFKLCIASAAAESGKTITHKCTGSVRVGNIDFGCLKSHGEMNLETATAYSCNSYFIKLGERCGADSCFRMAKLMGFGAENKLCSGITSADGSLNDINDLRRNPAALANFSFGQGQVMTTPLQVASMIACIANGGKRYEPTLVESVTDKKGNVTKTAKKAPTVVMSKKSAETVKSCMKATMTYGTGKTAAPKDGTYGGKTATAQTARYDKNGKECLQAWFAGFVEYKNKSCSIVVLAENGVSGGVSAGPVFKEIADKIF